MNRTNRSDIAKLIVSTRGRKSLPPRKTPYFIPKAHSGEKWQLGFEKLAHLEAWVIRWQRVDRSGYTVRRIGSPKPIGDLDYRAAWKLAQSVFDREFESSINPRVHRTLASKRAALPENHGCRETTITDCFVEYFAYLDCGESRRAKSSKAARQHYSAVIEYSADKPRGISDLRLVDLSNRRITKWRREISDDRAPSTVSRAIGTLRSAIRYFVENCADEEFRRLFRYDDIKASLATVRHETNVNAIPANLVTPLLFAEPKPRRRAYEPDSSFEKRVKEWGRTYSAFRIALRLGLEVGCRWEEIRSANIADWNSHERLLRLRYTKNKRDRYVAINEVLARDLNGVTAGGQPEWPLLVRGDDKRFADGDQKKHMDRISKLLTAQRGQQVKLTFHMTRHTFSTECANAGMPSIVLAKQLGHSDLSIVESVYYSDNAKRRVGIIDQFAPIYVGNREHKVTQLDTLRNSNHNNLSR